MFLMTTLSHDSETDTVLGPLRFVPVKHATPTPFAGS